MKNPYHCQECGGDGQVECPHCEQDMDCECCDGTGYNLDLLDCSRLAKAERRLCKQGVSCEWIRDGVWVGRMTVDGKSRLAYKDFLLPGVAPPFEDDSTTHWHDNSQLPLF